MSHSDDELKLNIPPSYTISLLEQLQQLGLDKIVDASDDLSEFSLCYNNKNHDHFLHIRVPERFPDEIPTVKTQLPEIFNPTWGKVCHSP